MQKATTISAALDLDSRLESLLLLLDFLLGLGSHDTATPLSPAVLRLLYVSAFDRLNELGELALVLGSDLSQGQDGSRLRSVSIPHISI